MFGGNDWNLTDTAATANVTISDDPISFEFPSGRFSLPNCIKAYQESCLNTPPSANVPFPVLPPPQPVVVDGNQYVVRPHQDQFVQVMATPPLVIPMMMNMMSIQQNLQFQYNGAGAPYNASATATGHPPMNLWTTNSQSSRRRKRKPQPRKVIEMTAEQLTAEAPMWQRYGEKSIKGSPYPRHYYRCNVGKGCAARKQVEQSKVEPDKFVVSYFSEHTHRRLLHT